jgi:5'-nucleotidase
MLARSFAVGLGAVVLAGALAGVGCGSDGGRGAPSPGASDDAGADAEGAGPVTVSILAFNDFHGNLEPPVGSSAYVIAPKGDPEIAGLPSIDAGAGHVAVKAGGAAYLAARVHALRASAPGSVVVSAGDLTGASPLVSNVFHDEPSVLVMNELGLALEGVGNHELDRGLAELLRLQNGGCHPTDGCTKGEPPFPGAKFHYLAANVSDASGQTIFPPYEILTIAGEKIAFVGMTLQQTKAIVPASAVSGLTFGDEAATVNALVPELEAQGVASIVVLLHQGGVPAAGSTYADCGLDGDPFVDLVAAMDPKVDVVVSGHTHTPYVCTLGGRLVTSAASYGRVVTEIDLTVDHHAVVAKTATNHVVRQDVTPDPGVDAIVQRYVAIAAPTAKKVVGHVTADISNAPNAAGETALGDVLADAQLEASQAAGAVVAFTNSGGIRADLPYAEQSGEGDGVVTYEEAFRVQPFGDVLTVMDLTGKDLMDLLDRQATSGVLQISSSLSYAISGGEVDHATVRVAGAPVDPSATVRVVTNAYLAGGGDGFTPFTRGTDRTTTVVDLDAFVAYLEAHDPLAPPALGRITVE